MKKLLLVLVGAFGFLHANAIVYVSAGAGSWDTPTNWLPNGRPTTGDDVTVNHAMTLATPVDINIFILGATGSVSVGTSTLTLNSTVTGLGGTITSSTTGTVIYNQASNGQNVLAGVYGNLTFSNFTKVLASSGNIDIDGTFTPGSAVGHTITGSTIRYTNTGVGVQTVVAFNYNNLTVLNSTNPGYKDFSGNAIVDGVFTPPTNLRYCTGCNNSTVTFNGSGPQTIPAFLYMHLASTNSGARTLANSGTIAVYGVFTPGANSYTVTGSTFDYHSNGAQTIQAFDYNNLIVLGSNVGSIKTFSGTIRVAGTFTPPNNFLYTTIGNTFEYNGSGTQTIKSNFAYNNLVSSNTGARILDANGFPIDIYGTFTPGTNPYTITNSTIRYAGTVAQTITAFTYNNLTSLSTGARSWSTLGTVNIAGNFNAGTNAWTATNSTVAFTGSGNQTITGSCNWNNLSVFKTSGNLTVSSGTHVLTGALNVASNTVFAVGANSFTLQSDASATARIAQLGAGASITGSGFVIQRFVSARTANYADLASPIQASTIADWDTRPNGTNEIYMSGVGGPDGGAFGPGNSVFTWSEPAVNFVAVTSQATPLTPGRGFELFLGDNLQVLNNLTFDTRGTPSQGTQTLTPLLSFTGDGYNLIGNPFASYIAWNTVLANGTNMDNTYLIFDAASGTYLSYGAGTEIPASQGFWVHFTGAPTLSIPESAKTSTTTSTFHKKGDEEPYVNLKISNADEAIPYYHITKIDLNDVNEAVYDKGDLPYLKSPVKEAPFITTASSDGKQLCVNRLNRNNDALDVPVQAGVGVSGNYTIEVSGLEYAGYSCVLLEDKKEGVFVDVRTSPRYTFAIEKGDDKDRFVLHFTRESSCGSVLADNKITQVVPSGNMNIVQAEGGNTVIFDLESVQQASIKVTNVLGQEIAESRTLSVQKERIPVAVPSGYNGIYYITVTTGNNTLTKKFISLK